MAWLAPTSFTVVTADSLSPGYFLWHSGAACIAGGHGNVNVSESSRLSQLAEQQLCSVAREFR